MLVRQGRLGLIWNRRDMDQPVQAELASVMEGYRGATPSHQDQAWQTAFRQTRIRPVDRAKFPNGTSGDRDQLVARVLSVSFMAALPADRRAG